MSLCFGGQFEFSLLPSCNPPHNSKQDCQDQESDEEPAMSSSEEPNSHDPEDQGSEDTQPSEEIKQRTVHVLQEIVPSCDWELIFTHVVLRDALHKYKVVTAEPSWHLYSPMSSISIAVCSYHFRHN